MTTYGTACAKATRTTGGARQASGRPCSLLLSCSGRAECNELAAPPAPPMVDEVHRALEPGARKQTAQPKCECARRRAGAALGKRAQCGCDPACASALHG